MFYVYLLRSEKDGRFYIGQTMDIHRRLKEHNEGNVKSTRSCVPWILLGYELYPTRNAARYREYDLKHHSDKKQMWIDQLLSVTNG